jgi:hypothetical protein
LKMWPSASASIFIFFVQPRHHYWEYIEGYRRKIVWILLGAGRAIIVLSQLFQTHKRVRKATCNYRPASDSKLGRQEDKFRNKFDLCPASVP